MLQWKIIYIIPSRYDILEMLLKMVVITNQSICNGYATQSNAIGTVVSS